MKWQWNLSRFSGGTTAQVETLETRVKGRGLCVGNGRSQPTGRLLARRAVGGWATAAGGRRGGAYVEANVGRPAAAWCQAGRGGPAAAWCGAGRRRSSAAWCGAGRARERRRGAEQGGDNAGADLSFIFLT
jgi:hypothetical protein